MSKNNNCSPISVIDGAQIMINRYPEHTDFSYEMYKKFRDTSFEKKYYDSDKYKDIREVKEAASSFILVKSYYKNNNELEDCCLGSRVMDDWDKKEFVNDYRKRYVGKQHGIVPTIPYKYVSKIAKMYDGRFCIGYNYNDYYALGYYPREKINFGETWCWVDLEDELHCIKGQKQEHLPRESELRITDEKYLFPTIIDDKLELETYNVYQAETSEGTKIKAIKYNGDWFRLGPVVWQKIGDDLVCTNIIFESPVHMKNDYVKNDDIQSFDDTFLKWYIDNIFTRDLFKNADYNLIKNQMISSIGEDIDAKLKEIERLKQIKSNLILQKQREEHFIDTAHRNIAKLFEEDSKEQEVRTLHK